MDSEVIFISLFHLFHFALCSGVRRGNGKDLEEGRGFGEGQLNGGCLVSMSNR
jgi:hypothetical protein